MKKALKPIVVCLIFFTFTTTVQSIELSGVDVHGFLSQGYLKSSDYNYHADTEDGSYEFNEFGINFGKDLTDELHFGLQLFSRDFGKTGNNEITLDWAYGDYRWKDWLGFRAGKIKMPQGLYNESRDVDDLRTWIFLPTSVYPETLRDFNLAMMGSGIYGNVDMDNFGLLSYQAMGGTVEMDDEDARLAYHLRAASQNITDLQSTDITVDSRYALALVWETPLDGLRVGGTYNETKLSAVAISDTPETVQISTEFNYIKNTVGSVEYTWNELLLVAEYIKTEYDYDDSNNLGLDHLTGNKHQESDGWYLGATYEFTKWFQIGGYYSEQYNDVDHRDGIGGRPQDFDPFHRAYLKDICLTTRFNVNQYMSIKLEGHTFSGTDSLFPMENVPVSEEEAWFNKGEDWNLLAAKVTFTF